MDRSKPDYDEPPSLPPRSADSLEDEEPTPPPLPHRELDEGEYEDIAPAKFTG